MKDSAFKRYRDNYDQAFGIKPMPTIAEWYRLTKVKPEDWSNMYRNKWPESESEGVVDRNSA